MAPRPPLGMSVVMRGPSGNEVTWWSGAPRAGDRPTGINFRTERGSGFLDGGCSLSRDIRGEYVDLGMLNEVTFVGDDGEIRYQGSLVNTPRSVDNSGHSIGPQFVGPIALAQDKPLSEVYCDRQATSWGDAPLVEQAALLNGGISLGDFSWSTGADGIVCALPTNALGAQTVAELWYIAPDGVLVGKAMYVGTDLSIPAGYEAALLYGSSDDHRTAVETYALTMDGSVHTATLTTARGFLMIRVYSSGNARTPAPGSSRRYSEVGVYGTHGLATYPNGSSPEALHLTDILIDAFNRAASQIDTSQVQPNSTLIEHYVAAGMFPHDIALDLNKYSLWELGVWEDKRLQFEQVPLDDYDWEVRLSDGATTTLQGQDAKDLRNGIVVQFTEAGSGRARTLTPDDYPELRDDSVENPATQWGRTKWGAPYALSAPCTEDMAIFAGVEKLAEDNAPKEAGDINITGHVRDRAGHWQPASAVRAGERVIISDFANPRPRRVAQTAYTGDNYGQTLSVDNTMNRIESFFDFYGAALQAAGLI